MIPPCSFNMDFCTMDKNKSTIKTGKVLKCHFNFNFFFYFKLNLYIYMSTRSTKKVSIKIRRMRLYLGKKGTNYNRGTSETPATQRETVKPQRLARSPAERAPAPPPAPSPRCSFPGIKPQTTHGSRALEGYLSRATRLLLSRGR